MNDNKPITYKDAGVDIDAGNRFVDLIKPLVKQTSRPEVLADIGGFGGLFSLNSSKYQRPTLVAATDGVGTKLKLAFMLDKHDTVGIDLVAMCVNDLVCQGAEPLFFLDYFATGKLDVAEAAAVVGGIAEGCKRSNSALVGGETAEMPSMYAKGDFDLAGFSVGAMERGNSLPSGVQAGDVLLGLASSGVHSNGYSLVRKIVENSGLTWESPSPFGDGSLGKALLAPTKLYVRSGLAAHRAGGLHALAHITGGGLTENLPRALPQGLGAEVKLSAWPLPPVIKWLAEQAGLAQAELLKTFNCGIGMVAIVAADRAEALIAIFEEHGEDVTRIGTVTEGEGMAYSGALK